MRVVVMPFATSSPEQAAWGRQFAHLLGECLKAFPGFEVMHVSYVARVQREDREELVLVGPSKERDQEDWSRKTLKHLQAHCAVHGALEVGQENIELVLRVSSSGQTGDSTSSVLIEIPGYEAPTVQEAEISVRRNDVARFVQEMVSCCMKLLGHPALASTSPADEKRVWDAFGEEGEPSSLAQLTEGEDQPAAEFARSLRPLVGAMKESEPEAILNFLLGWDALMYIRQAGEKLPKDADLLYALNALVTALRLDPDYLAPYEALLELCRHGLALELFSLDDVQSALEVAVEQCPDDWRGWYSLGDLLAKRGSTEVGLQHLIKASELNPADPAIWIRVALLQSRLGQIEAATRSFENAFDREIPGEHSFATPLYYSMLSSQGETERAHELWIKLRDRDPGATQGWIGLAYSHQRRGERSEMFNTLERALQEARELAPIHAELARAFMRDEEHHKALPHFREAALLAPDNLPLHLEYAECLHMCGRSEESIDVLHTLLSKNPPPPFRAKAESRLLELEQPHKLQRFQQLVRRVFEWKDPSALIELEQLAEWLRGYWPMWEALSIALNQFEQHTKAEWAAKRLIELLPDHIVGYTELAEALFKQGKAEEAYRRLKHAARYMPDAPSVLGNLGIAAAITGRTAEAELIRDALERIGESELSERLSGYLRRDPAD